MLQIIWTSFIDRIVKRYISSGTPSCFSPSLSSGDYFAIQTITDSLAALQAKEDIESDKDNLSDNNARMQLVQTAKGVAITPST